MLKDYFEKYKLSDSQNISQERINADKDAVFARISKENDKITRAGNPYMNTDSEEIYKFGETINSENCKPEKTNKFMMFMKIAGACAAAAAVAVIVPFAAKHIRTRTAESSEQVQGASYSDSFVSADDSQGEDASADKSHAAGSLTDEELGITYVYTSVDSAVYGTEELVKRADYVFIGTVTDVNFYAFRSTCTNNHDHSQDIPIMESSYSVEAQKVYKNIDASELTDIPFTDISFRRPGGIKDKYLDKQAEALERAGAPKIIRICEAPEIVVGETYLFLLWKVDDSMVMPVSMIQGAYPLDGVNSDAYLSDEAEKYPVSALDIIARFGQDAVREFLNEDSYPGLNVQCVTDTWKSDFCFYMPEFSGVKFVLENDKTITANGRVLFKGGKGVYLADLDGDGLREICGLRMAETEKPFIVIYDYAAGEDYYYGIDGFDVFDSAGLYIKDGELYVGNLNTDLSGIFREIKVVYPVSWSERLPE